MTQNLQFKILIDEVVSNYDKYDAEKLAAAKRAIIGSLQLKDFPKMRAAKALENILDKLMELSKALAVLPQVPDDIRYCNWFIQINNDLTPVVKEYQKLFAQELLELKDNGTRTFRTKRQWHRKLRNKKQRKRIQGIKEYINFAHVKNELLFIRHYPT